MLLIWISRCQVQYNQKLYTDWLKHHMTHFYQDFTDYSYQIVLRAEAFLDPNLYFRSHNIKTIIYLASYVWLQEHHLKNFGRISKILIGL